MGHSQDMAAHDQFSHTSSDGSSLGDRAERAGFYTFPLGENIAAGYTSVRDIVLAWMWCALLFTSKWLASRIPAAEAAARAIRA